MLILGWLLWVDEGWFNKSVFMEIVVILCLVFVEKFLEDFECCKEVVNKVLFDLIEENLFFILKCVFGYEIFW